MHATNQALKMINSDAKRELLHSKVMSVADQILEMLSFIDVARNSFNNKFLRVQTILNNCATIVYVCLQRQELL